jgi:tripartite-type tricarboxylate transporter receptor subunit TctC
MILGTNTTHAVAASLYKKLPFDPQRDFVAITEIAIIPQLLSLHPSIPARSVKELVALARARPGELNYGTAGSGSTSHMAMELFLSMAKVKMTHVPYKGTGPALSDLLGGHLSLMFDVIMTSLPHTQSGKLRTIGISSLERAPLTPNVPTIAESGYPGFEVEVGYFVMMPAKTPDAVTREVEARLRRALGESEVQARIRLLGIEPAPAMSAEQGARWIAVEYDKWAKVIREKNIKAE